MDLQTSEKGLERKADVSNEAQSISNIHHHPEQISLVLSNLSNPSPHGSTTNDDFMRRIPSDEAYSSFSKPAKRWITLLVAMSGFFSPLSANIYFPAVTYISQDFQVSLELVNLTITAYLICQCITPSITGDLADMIGRRPVYLVVLVVYFAANLGLSLQKTYAGLLVLRMIQSTGASGTIALCLSVIHDIAAPHERGKYMGAAMTGPNAAPSIGPVLGGVLAQKAGWQWIFGFLGILSGLNLVLMVLFFPETGRAIVGNGSAPANGINRTLMSCIVPRGRSSDPSVALKKPKLRFPNPLTALKILFKKDVALIMYTNGVFYINYQCTSASLSSVFMRVYRLNALEAGLCYLPYGIVCTAGTFLTGMVIDRDYRITAAAVGFTINKKKGDDLTNFPIEKARLRSIWYFMGLLIISTIGYGWSVHTKTVRPDPLDIDEDANLTWMYQNMAVPLVLQFLCGIGVTGTFNILRTLTIDLHPVNPATASATINIIRGTFAAVGVSIIQVLLDNLGIGWTFTLLAGLCATAYPLLSIELRYGMGWRRARELRKKEERHSHDAGVLAAKS